MPTRSAAAKALTVRSCRLAAAGALNVQSDSRIIEKLNLRKESAHRSFAQPAACLHVPATLTPEPTKHEARKRRASERHAVGCSEELARS